MMGVLGDDAALLRRYLGADGSVHQEFALFFDINQPESGDGPSCGQGTNEGRIGFRQVFSATSEPFSARSHVLTQKLSII